MIRYITVKIMRDVLSTVERTVPEWEVPILDSVNSGQLQLVEGKDRIVDRPLPDARSEHDRLEAAYRGCARSENGTPTASVVAAVYGEGPRGFRALKDAIEAAYIAEWPAGYVADLVEGANIVTDFRAG